MGYFCENYVIIHSYNRVLVSESEKIRRYISVFRISNVKIDIFFIYKNISDLRTGQMRLKETVRTQGSNPAAPTDGP
jgi:hypothetical protein